MNLYNAAKRFNTQLAADAYTGDTFMCQFEPMSFSKIDGVSIEKRQLSVEPTVAIPPNIGPTGSASAPHTMYYGRKIVHIALAGPAGAGRVAVRYGSGWTRLDDFLRRTGAAEARAFGEMVRSIPFVWYF